MTAKKLASVPSTDLDIASKSILAIEQQMNYALLERKNVVRSMFLSYLSNEHILLLGDPGTGKSFMADLFAHFMAGGSWFEIQMSKSTTIDELFGLVMLSEFKKDNWKRKFEGYAPTAKIWFMDEIFKCNSQTLNGTLTAINERKIRNGDKVVKIPLEMVVAASNEYPEDKSLAALYDRFATKFWIDDLQDDDNMDILWEQDNGLAPKPLLDATITQAEIDTLKQAVKDFELSKNDVSIMRAIRVTCRDAGFTGSVRTWRKAPKLIKANAVMHGRNYLVPSDYMVLADMLWKVAKDRDTLYTVIGNSADPYGSRSTAIIDGIRLAMTEIPDFSLLKSGAMTKPEFIGGLAKVQVMLSSSNGKIADLEDSSPDNSSVAIARDKWNSAKQVIDNAMNEAVSYR